MSEVKIKKLKIKDDLFLEGEYDEELPGHSKKNSKFSCTVPVHDDLKAAFKRLHVHLAILCDEIKTPKKKDFEALQQEFEAMRDADQTATASGHPFFTVHGITIGGKEENEGVTVSGYKNGTYGLVNLNTPFTTWSSEEYPFSSQLSEDIEALIYEGDQYLFNEKRAPEKQLAMEFGEGDEEGGEENTEQ